MEGLHYRKKEKANQEDEAEFLDEEEQEKLITELREQNDTANINIQRGLILIGLIVSSLFFSILFQKSSLVTIPITAIYNVQASVLSSPRLAAVTCIISIFASIFTLILSSRVNLISFVQNTSSIIPVKYAAMTAITFSLISPIMSLLHHSSSIELLFWTIPSILISMYYLAYSMINQVYQSLEELEGSKYKYKGA